jgi:hypothetical protein
MNELTKYDWRKNIWRSPIKTYYVMTEFDKNVYKDLTGKEPVEGDMYYGMEIIFAENKHE